MKELLDMLLVCCNEKDIVETIIKVNEQENYWVEKTSMVMAPHPNMSVYTGPDLVPYAEDIISNEVFPNLLANFIIRTSHMFPNLSLYVHQSRFGFGGPIFGLRHLDYIKKSPYLIKFRKENLSQEMYDMMIAVLYSIENRRKHEHFLLEKINILSHYEY